jgi:hypothetical protein
VSYPADAILAAIVVMFLKTFEQTEQNMKSDTTDKQGITIHTAAPQPESSMDQQERAEHAPADALK